MNYPVYECKPTEKYSIKDFLRINGWSYALEGELIKTTKIQDLHMLELQSPLELIFHGTNACNILSIMENGLKKSEDGSIFLSTYFGKSLGYGLLQPEKKNKKFGIVVIDFDYIQNKIKDDLEGHITPLDNPDLTDWTSWFIINFKEDIPPEQIKAILWAEPKYFSQTRSRTMPYYAGFIKKILEIQETL